VSWESTQCIAIVILIVNVLLNTALATNAYHYAASLKHWGNLMMIAIVKQIPIVHLDYVTLTLVNLLAMKFKYKVFIVMHAFVLIIQNVRLGTVAAQSCVNQVVPHHNQ
jgi:hypothetical protein